MVSPYSTIKQAAGEAMAEQGGGTSRSGTASATLVLDGKRMGRVLFPYIQGEATRQGLHLAGGKRTW